MDPSHGRDPEDPAAYEPELGDSIVEKLELNVVPFCYRGQYKHIAFVREDGKEDEIVMPPVWVGESQTMLQVEASINQLLPGGTTVLHNAVRECTTDQINLLLDAKADPNFKDALGYTPLFFARSVGAISDLVRAKADINANEGGMTTLMRSAQNDDYHLARILLDFEPDTEIVDKKGFTPLYYARSTMLIDVLLHHGANINTRTETGETPLMHAIRSGIHHIANHLIKAQADVNATNCDGETALHISLSAGSVSNARFITPMNVMQVTNRGDSVLHIAYSRRMLYSYCSLLIDGLTATRGEMTRALSDFLPEPVVSIVHEYLDITNLQDRYGQTALILAVKSGVGLDQLALLMKLEPDRTLRDRNGDSAPDLIKRDPACELYRESQIAIVTQTPPECAICMETGGAYAVLTCQHWFHLACISDWAVKKCTCPTCRRAIGYQSREICIRKPAEWP